MNNDLTSNDIYDILNLLKNCKTYFEDIAVLGESEFGDSKSLEEMVKNLDLPVIYYDLLSIIKKLEKTEEKQ